MEEWIQQVFDSPEFGLAMLPAALGLGLLASLGSCCNYAIWVAIGGYAASRPDRGRREMLLMPLGFILGTAVFMAALGWLIGIFGEFMGETFKFYGTLVAGFVAILFGLAALNMVPFKLPAPDLAKRKMPEGFWSSGLFGLVVGGTSVACSTCCGPVLPLVLGLVALTGQGLWGALILGMFAVGYGLPFGAAMIGVSLGRSTRAAQRLVDPIRKVAGVVIIAAGFWMLWSVQ